MSEQTIIIGQRIKNNTADVHFRPYPNIDWIYGPYDSVADALSNIDMSIRNVYLTVGIKNLGEYWFVNGIQDSDFVLKCHKDFTDDINTLTAFSEATRDGLDNTIVNVNKNTSDINDLTSNKQDVIPNLNNIINLALNSLQNNENIKVKSVIVGDPDSGTYIFIEKDKITLSDNNKSTTITVDFIEKVKQLLGL